MSYTPGPWVACGAERVWIAGIEVGPCVIVSTGLEDKHRDICCVTSKKSIEDGDIANARLIAAAPELLEALKACHEEAVREYHGSGGSTAWERHLAVEAVDPQCSFCAAIRKAEGRE